MFESLKTKTPRFGVQSPFLQQVRGLRGRMGKLIFRLLLVLVPLFLLRSCVITYVGPGEIGVRQIAYGPSRGLQKKPVSPGYRREIASYETVHTFPRDIQAVDSLDRGYSVMQQLQLWFSPDWPNWPLQLAGIVILLAPLARYALWEDQRFRLHFLASLLMFCVLFNHKSESPTFVVALAGVAIWFALAPRVARTWVILGLVVVGTVLSSSDAMPEVLQEGVFEPYRLKTLPVLLVWILTQVEMWRAPRSGRAALQESSSPRAAPAT